MDKGKIEVEQETLDEIKFEANCHIFWNGAQFSFCGVPRKENPVHRPPMPGKTGYATMPYCPYDGLKHCEKCREMAGKE